MSEHDTHPRTIRTAVTCLTFDLDLDGPAAFTLELADGSTFDVSGDIGEAVLVAFRHIRERAEREFDLVDLNGSRLPPSLPPTVVQLRVEDGDEHPVRRVVGVQVDGGPWLTNGAVNDTVRGGR